MVGAPERLRLASVGSQTPPTGHGTSRHRWHRRQRSGLRHHLRTRRSIVGTLVRLDDDPLLLCDCAEGAPHTCS